jgi:hypothetical protein
MLAVTPEAVGNCYSACIASLLAADSIDDVPHFQMLRNIDEYHAAMELPFHDRRLAREWLRRTHELDMACVDADWVAGLGDVHYIITVKSHGGPWNHAVIARAGEVVFDPSGRDDYSYADRDPDDNTAEALVLPYAPGPVELTQQWVAALRSLEAVAS